MWDDVASNFPTKIEGGNWESQISSTSTYFNPSRSSMTNTFPGILFMTFPKLRLRVAVEGEASAQMKHVTPVTSSNLGEVVNYFSNSLRIHRDQ